jgi:glutathione S-transferase
MAAAVLTISSRNYSSWSLRGFLLCKLAGIEFTAKVLPIDDPSSRAELLLMSPSFLVPRLEQGGAKIWDTWAIAEYLAELHPDAGMFPKDAIKRARCRSVSGEMHSGFYNLRSALPMNLRANYPGFKAWAGAQGDIARVRAIWQDCIEENGGPYLFGKKPTVADAMYAPVCTRFQTYNVQLDDVCAAYCETILKWPAMVEWVEAAKAEPEQLEELEGDF